MRVSLWRLGRFTPLMLPLVLGAPAYAQTTASSRTLTVHGHAEMKAKPDLARVSLTVTTQARQRAEASQANMRKMEAVLAALRKAGVAARDIETEDYTVEPQYHTHKGLPVLVGFQVSNAVQVTVHDLRKAGEVIEWASRAGATEVSNLTYDFSDRHKIEDGALAAALANAQAKARFMAGAIDRSVGDVLTVMEGTAPSVEPIRAYGGGFGGYPAPRPAVVASAPALVSPKQTVTADVTVVYSLEDAQAARR